MDDHPDAQATVEALLSADDLFKSAPDTIIPIVILEPEHHQERGSFEQFTCLDRFIAPPLSPESIQQGLARLAGGVFGTTTAVPPTAPRPELFPRPRAG